MYANTKNKRDISEEEKTFFSPLPIRRRSTTQEMLEVIDLVTPPPKFQAEIDDLSPEIIDLTAPNEDAATAAGCDALLTGDFDFQTPSAAQRQGAHPSDITQGLFAEFAVECLAPFNSKNFASIAPPAHQQTAQLIIQQPNAAKDLNSPSSDAGGFFRAQSAIIEFPVHESQLDKNLQCVYDRVRIATRTREGLSSPTKLKKVALLRLIWLKANDPQWCSSLHMSPEERSGLLQSIPDIGPVRGNTSSTWVQRGPLGLATFIVDFMDSDEVVKTMLKKFRDALPQTRTDKPGYLI